MQIQVCGEPWWLMLNVNEPDPIACREYVLMYYIPVFTGKKGEEQADMHVSHYFYYLLDILSSCFFLENSYILMGGGDLNRDFIVKLICNSSQDYGRLVIKNFWLKFF